MITFTTKLHSVAGGFAQLAMQPGVSGVLVSIALNLNVTNGAESPAAAVSLAPFTDANDLIEPFNKQGVLAWLKVSQFFETSSGRTLLFSHEHFRDLSFPVDPQTTLMLSISGTASDVVVTLYFVPQIQGHVSQRKQKKVLLPLPEKETFESVFGRVNKGSKVMTTRQAFEALGDFIDYNTTFLDEFLRSQVLFLTKAEMLLLETDIGASRAIEIYNDWLFNGLDSIKKYLLIPQLGFASTNLGDFTLSGLQFGIEEILARTLRQNTLRLPWIQKVKNLPGAVEITRRHRVAGVLTS